MVRPSLVDPRTAWRGIAVGLVVGAVLAAGSLSRVLGAPYDALQDRLWPGPAPAGEVTLVALDQVSENELARHDWPISNSYHARVIDALARLRPRVIVFDIVLNNESGPDENGVDTDKQLLDSIRNAGNVVIACDADTSDQPFSRFAAAAAAVGDRGFGPPDRAGAVRSVPLRAGCGGTEPLFVQAVRRAGYKAPPTGGGQMLINFSNGASRTCPYRRAIAPGCAPELIRDRIVVVGVKVLNADDVHTQTVSFAHDAAFCPPHNPNCMAGNQNYGYRMVADEIGTVLSQRHLNLEPELWVAAAVLVLAGLAGGLVYVLSLRRAILALAVLIAAYLLALVLLSRAGQIGDPVFAPAAIILGGAAGLVASYLLEERERRKVEAIFGQYVDPGIVSDLVALRSADDVRLGGVRQPLTVLFCDVRGFTSLAERIAPEEVITLLNDFTERCSQIVFDCGGTVDKYIGDSVMAFWNAPRPEPNHAGRAVQAGLLIAAAGGSLLGERGIGVGVGICSGDAVVGNVGGSNRKQYTAIGDVVNVASRLCGAAPAGAVLVAGSTWALLENPPPAERLEPLTVKGRAEAVEVHLLAAPGPAQ